MRTGKSFRPGFESLETRMVPAFISGNALVIEGGNGADQVLVIEDHQANQIQVIQNGQVQNFSSAGILNINANLGKGNNSFSYRLGGGSDFTDAKNINVVLGPAVVFMPGKNQATFDLANDGAGGLADVRANLNISVLGSSGADSVQATFNMVEDANVRLTTQLRHGDDTVTANIMGDLEDSDVTFDLQEANDLAFQGFKFKGGNDSMTVLADADVDLDAGSNLNVLMNGMARNDMLTFRYDGELDGTLFLRMDGGAGRDSAQAMITLDNFSDGSLDAIVRGGANGDIVQLLLTDNSNGDVDILNALSLQD